MLPLTLEGRLIGVLGLSFGRDMKFSASRRQMKLTLARQAALALERTRLYEAERAARQRLAFIAEASELLSSSLEYEETLARLARLAVPQLADWCAIDMVGPGGEIERLVVAHEDPEKARWAKELQERYPPKADDRHGVAYVIRTGEPEFFPEFTKARLAGCTLGGSFLKLRSIHLGFHMEFALATGVIITSPVRTIDVASPDLTSSGIN